VGVEEIKKVLKEIVLPVFLPGKADLVVTCASIMEEVSCFCRCTRFLLSSVASCGKRINNC